MNKVAGGVMGICLSSFLLAMLASQAAWGAEAKGTAKSAEKSVRKDSGAGEAKAEKKGAEKDAPASKGAEKDAPASKGAEKDAPAAGAKNEPAGSAAPLPGAPKPLVTPPPAPKFKAAEDDEKFQDGLKKMLDEDYTGARNIFNALLKDVASTADRKALQGFIDDTKLGSEIEASRKMVEKKDERKAIARVEKALKSYPTSCLKPVAEKFVRETEEIIYLIFDDFEPGETFEKEVKDLPTTRSSEDSTTSKGRWRMGMSFNSDPRFIRHGKGSMKWRVGGEYGYWSSSYSSYGYGYRTNEIKNPISKWRYLVFSVCLPEMDEGNLRVALAPNIDSGVLYSLYTQKFIEFRNKKGWIDVRLDLNRDFGNTKNIKLDDVRFIRIEYISPKMRTIYVDFVHLE